MSAVVSLFELAAELTRRHERATLGQITVIPVLVEDLETALPVLGALCTLTGGRLMNVRDPELQKAVPTTPDGFRRAAIPRALIAGLTGTRHVDLVDVGHDLVDAEFADPPAGLPSPGEETVLGVARAVAHNDLDKHGLAVITYREDLVDLPFRRAIWALAVDQLHKMGNPTLRTLVFVAQGAINIGLHCQLGRGFRFAVVGGRLLHRKSADDLNAEAAWIARQTEPFVLYLGAGFSVSSQLPLGNAIRDEAIRRLLNIPPTELLESSELAVRFHDWIVEKHWLARSEESLTQADFVKQLTLEQVVRIEQRMDPTLPTLRDFRVQHDRILGTPGPAVRDLAAVLEKAVGRIIIVEVNFDELVETHSPVPVRVFASEAEFVRAPDYLRGYLAGRETSIPILKLHGTISDPTSCVVSAEQTEAGIGQGKLDALRVLMGQHDRKRLWIYVGTTMRDLDIRPVLQHEDFARGLDERWVSPYLTDTVEEFGARREPHWRTTSHWTTDDRLISETADPFFAALRSAWL